MPVSVSTAVRPYAVDEVKGYRAVFWVAAAGCAGAVGLGVVLTKMLKEDKERRGRGGSGRGGAGYLTNVEG